MSLSLSKDFSESRHAQADACFDRPQGNIQLLRNLDMGHLGKEGKSECLALIGGQLAEGVAEPPRGFNAAQGPSGWIRGQQGFANLGRDLLPVRPPPSEMVQCP